MSSGGFYVDNKFAESEAYSPVAAYSVSARDVPIPSGASIVHGIYYMWNDEGFIGQSWYTGIEGGPTYEFNNRQYANNDSAFAEYAATVPNLNAVFTEWAENYTLDGWDAFYNAVGKDSGCMNVAH